MAVFFTSDTHFGHERIISLCNRPFDSVEEMNEVMIDNWNSVVGPKDIVYHMGDVALGRIAESLPLVGKLNGDIALVPGNHDRIFSGEKERQRLRFDAEYRKVFATILPESLVVDVAGFDVAMSHFPYSGDSHGEDRHADKRPRDEGLPLIHGHVHDKWKTNGRMLNVGVDVHDFRPVSRDYVVDWLEGL